jgi:flagellar protein FliO/FliZ
VDRFRRPPIAARLSRAFLAAGVCLLVLAPTALASAFERDRTPLPAGVTGASGSADAGAATGAGSGATGAIVRGVVGLFVVLAVVYGLYWLLRSAARSRSGGSDGRMEVVATTTLGANRSLHLVRAGGELIMIGVAEQAITPIRVYSQEEAERLELEARVAEQFRPTGGDAPAGGAGGLVDLLRRRTVRG